MSTKELRAYIDRLLGNSLRCLLPSYWWKRAFNVTADAIDTIETDTQEKIGEVQQQVDKLVDKLAEKRVLYADNPQDHKEENLAMINILWGEYLVDRGHDPVYLVTEDGAWLSPNFTVQSNHIYFYNVPRKNNSGTTRQKLYTYHIYDKAGGEVVIEISDSFEHYVNQSSQNAVQSSAVYTAMQAKQDKLVSGSNIKTINGMSILGNGDLKIETPDVIVSHLATKEEVKNVISELIDDEEVLAHSLNDLNDRMDNIAGELSGDFASKEEVDAAIETLTNADAANQQAIESVSGNVSTLTERVDNIASELTEDFATKDEVQTVVDNLTNEVINDEEVLAHAINDLNDRLNEIITRLNNAGL